ncbi:MAG: hypothetical protein ACLFPV_05350 [Spirochaetaceae bacterium]
MRAHSILTLGLTTSLILILGACAGSGGGSDEGGGESHQIVVAGFIVEPGDPPATNSRDVLLSIAVENAQEMRFRNELSPSFEGIPWHAVESDFPWSLSEGDGEKTVFAEFRNGSGGYAEASDNIVLSTQGPTVVEFAVAGDALYTNTRSVSVSMVAPNAATIRLGNESAGGSIEWEDSALPAENPRSWTLTPGDGTKRVYGEFSDALGNTTTVSDQIVLDTVPPTISNFRINRDPRSLDNPPYINDRDVWLRSSASGATQMRVKEGTAAWPGNPESGWVAFSDSVAFTLSAGDGEKRVDAQYRDAAENVASASDTITLDTTPPTGYLTLRDVSSSLYSYTDKRIVTLDLTVSGDYRPLKYTAWYRYANDMRWQTYVPSSGPEIETELSPIAGTKTVQIQVQDDALNVATFTDTINYSPTFASIDSYDVYEASWTDDFGQSVILAGADSGSRRDDLPQGTIVVFKTNYTPPGGSVNRGKLEVTGRWDGNDFFNHIRMRMTLYRGHTNPPQAVDTHELYFRGDPSHPYCYDLDTNTEYSDCWDWKDFPAADLCWTVGNYYDGVYRNFSPVNGAEFVIYRPGN